MKGIFNISKVFLAALLVSAVLAGCSRKKDSWTSRTYHKMTSKFNPYFNGEQAYLEGSATMQANHKDNYEEILKVYRWGTVEQATSVAPQMDRAIEKSVKVIQDHNMEIGGKQKNTYVVKSYMLMGKARFYKHDFFPALETFNYVIQQYAKDKKAVDIVAEAQLWAGRCQLMIGNPQSAQAYFEEIYNNKRIDKGLKADISASRAQAFIDDEKYEEAVYSLKEAIDEGAPKQQRIRWTFIMAQLNERLDLSYEASRDYKAVIDMKPSNYDMLFTAQLNRAKNFDVYMENANIVYRELEKMLKDEKNLEYRDQIYYVMAEVALAEEEYDKAEGYLTQSIRTSVTNNTQKGLSYLLIGEINFDFRDYVPAQAYYDSASTTLPQGHKQFAYAQKRAKSLEGLVKNINIIEKEDSLQRLAGMSEAQQRRIFEQYIENLKEEEERKRREEELKRLNAELQNQSQNMAGGPSVASRQGWYFYNTNTRSSGTAAFQSFWGTRKLEDNWRQKNKQASFETAESGSDSTSSTTGDKYSADKYQPEYYMAQIPSTEAEIDSSNNRIKAAYLALGDIYKNELKDLELAVSSYEKLLERFPGNEYEPRVLFSLYRLFVDDGKQEKAQPPKQKLITTYPNSVYTKLILNPGKLDRNDDSYKEIAALYKTQYDEFLKGNYKTVLRNLDKEEEQYAGSLLEPKFRLLAAMCLGKQKKKEEFITALKEIVALYPNTQEQQAAQSILDLSDDPSGGTANATGGIGDFKYDANVPHKFVVIVPNEGVDINALRNSFADYNQQYFKLERLQVQNIFLDQDRQLVIVSGLKNAAKAKVYYKGILSNQTLMGYMPSQITTKIIISDQNYRDLYRDKNLSQYLNFLKEKYQIEESI